MLGAAWMRVLLPAAIAAIFALSFPERAEAQFHVAGPEVVKGQGEIADHGAFYVGPGTEEKLDQGHELELYYGLTDRLAFLTIGLLQQKIGENLEATTYEIGGQYQLVKPDGEGFALAIRSLYQLSLQDGSPDQILLGPIAKLAGHDASATLDTFFVHDLNSSDTTALETKWQVKRRLSDRMSFGVEGYGKIADLADPGSFEAQEHRVGPVVYLKLGQWMGQEFHDVSGVGEEKIWGASFGALFGLTEATSDVAFKFNLSGVF
jgi:hypothetical protein